MELITFWCIRQETFNLLSRLGVAARVVIRDGRLISAIEILLFGVLGRRDPCAHKSSAYRHQQKPRQLAHCPPPRLPREQFAATQNTTPGARTGARPRGVFILA